MPPSKPNEAYMYAGQVENSEKKLQDAYFTCSVIGGKLTIKWAADNKGRKFSEDYSETDSEFCLRVLYKGQFSDSWPLIYKRDGKMRKKVNTEDIIKDTLKMVWTDRYGDPEDPPASASIEPAPLDKYLSEEYPSDDDVVKFKPIPVTKFNFDFANTLSDDSTPPSSGESQVKAQAQSHNKNIQDYYERKTRHADAIIDDFINGTFKASATPLHRSHLSTIDIIEFAYLEKGFVIDRESLVKAQDEFCRQDFMDDIRKSKHWKEPCRIATSSSSATIAPTLKSKAAEPNKSPTSNTLKRKRAHEMDNAQHKRTKGAVGDDLNLQEIGAEKNTGEFTDEVDAHLTESDKQYRKSMLERLQDDKLSKEAHDTARRILSLLEIKPRPIPQRIPPIIRTRQESRPRWTHDWRDKKVSKGSEDL